MNVAPGARRRTLGHALGLFAVGMLALIVAGCGSVATTVMLQNRQVKSVLKPRPADRSLTNPASVETIGSGDTRITVLYVSGAPYEMGYAHGRLLRTQVREAIADVEQGMEKFLPKSLRQTRLLTESDKQHIVNALLDRAYAELEPFIPPEDLEEMAGLADGSGAPLEVIHRLHAVPDVGETSCSALVAMNTATRDGHVYQLRILDYGANFNLQRRPLITVYRPDHAHAFVNIGWVGFVGVVSGVNNQLVALSEMGFGNPPGETLHGIPMPFLLKNVLRYADTAADGAAIVRAAPRTNSYVYFLGDRRQGAIGMITSAQRCQSYHANERDTLQVGDHVLPQFRDVIYAGHYEHQQADLVRAMRGSFDAAAIQDMARQIAMKSNLQTVIYDLTAGRIWVANRAGDTRAADRPYVEFSLTDAWAKHLRGNPQALAHPDR